MNRHFDTSLAASYHSASQQTRVLTESWVADNLYCPRCGAPRIKHLGNNKPVADFACPECGDIFELKSSGSGYHDKVVDGAYDTMMRRLADMDTDFLFLFYNRKEQQVSDLLLVPKHYFVPAIIEKRKPLAPTARRAGWTGCTILLGAVPSYGRLPIISHGKEADKAAILAQYKKTDFLAGLSLNKKSWLFDILSCVAELPESFTLADMYRFETRLSLLHPENHNIRPKIRQQLQVLRDKGVLRFAGGGVYEKC